MKIIRATRQHLDDLVPLFDGYRMFYRQAPDRDPIKTFLGERFQKNDSVIFLAYDSERNAIGFTQLYPSFSSVSMQRLYILNDLFVSENARRQGVGEALLEHAKEFSRATGSKGLVLETEIDNPAQKLYERLGWKKDDQVFHYTWTV